MQIKLNATGGCISQHIPAGVIAKPGAALSRWYPTCPWPPVTRGPPAHNQLSALVTQRVHALLVRRYISEHVRSMLARDHKDRSIDHARQASPNVGSIQRILSQLPSLRTRDRERWKWYSPYSRCRYLATDLSSSSLLLFISWLFVFLRSLRCVLASYLTAAFQSGIRTIRETWHFIRRGWLRLRHSHLRRSHALSFRCRARKIRRAIDAVCTPWSTTRRKLRSGLCWLYENLRHCSMIGSEARVYYVHRAEQEEEKRWNER